MNNAKWIARKSAQTGINPEILYGILVERIVTSKAYKQLAITKNDVPAYVSGSCPAKCSEAVEMRTLAKVRASFAQHQHREKNQRTKVTVALPRHLNDKLNELVSSDKARSKQVLIEAALEQYLAGYEAKRDSYFSR